MQEELTDPVPLTTAGAGDIRKVVAIRGGFLVRRRLESMGLLPGTPVRLLRAGGQGPVLVEVRGSRLVLGRGMARRVFVGPSQGQQPGEASPTAQRTTLADLREGESARIATVRGEPALRRRLLDMGLTRGALLRVERYAPLRNPIEIRVKGYLLALRVEEAGEIEVERGD